MGRVLGVDVSLGRGLDVALLEGARILHTVNLPGPSALRTLLQDERPDAVAIDAPPREGLGLLRDRGFADSLPVPPRPGTHLDRRVAEFELSRRGIGSHQTPPERGRLFTWMTAGFETFEAAAAGGYELWLGEGNLLGRAFEAFPYASYVVLAGCLSPGRKHRLWWRRAVLEGQDLRGLPADASIDALDAVCAALTAARALAAPPAWVGDPREGVIVLPGAPADRYRRCAAPHMTVEPPAQRLCECGCGEPVRRRFLPGHDAKLKAQLLVAARAGDTAHRELERLGWTATARGGQSATPPRGRSHSG